MSMYQKTPANIGSNLLTISSRANMIILTELTTPLNNAYHGGTFLYVRNYMAHVPEKIEPKIATTFEEQIEILKSRNLIISDVKEAKDILKRISYYRLSGYMLTTSIKALIDKYEDVKNIY